MQNTTSPTPLVTIYCLTYNHEQYIRQCLDGFIMQRTDFPFEILVHDDASTDSTPSILKEYEEKYPELFHVIYEKENLYTRRDGELYTSVTKEVRGRYIAYCEGDDYWTNPDKLQMQADYMEQHPDCGLVYTNLDFLYEDSGEVVHDFVTTASTHVPHNFAEHLMWLGSVMPCSWLVKTEFFRMMPKKFFIDFTFPLVLEVWANSRVDFIDVNTCVYRVLGESLSHSREFKGMYKIRKGLFEIQKEYMAKYPGLIEPTVKKRFLYRLYREMYYCAAKAKDKEVIAECEAYYRQHPNIHNLWRMFKHRIGLL